MIITFIFLFMFSFYCSSAAFAEEIVLAEHSDAEAQAQWGLAAIGASKAHEAGFTGKGVRVGLFDSGLDIQHPEFAGRFDAQSLDIDASLQEGVAVAVSGDVEGHGTFVGGILAANRDGEGMHGVAYDAVLVPVSGDIGPDTFDPYTGLALRYLVSRRVEIVNVSLGVDEDEVPPGAGRDFIEGYIPAALSTLRDAGRQGVVTVWAAGNSGAGSAELMARLPRYYPEMESTILAVAALDRNGALASYSNKCGVAAAWCLAAPGGEGGMGDPSGVMSTWSGGGYSTEAGTSFAAPHVTGALAVARQIFPHADIRDLRRMILVTSTDLGEPGIDPVFGWGALNLGNVVDAIAPSGRAVFADAAWSRSIAMGQVARAPFASRSLRTGRSGPFWASADVLVAEIGPAVSLSNGTSLTGGVDLVDRGKLTAGLGWGYTATATRRPGSAGESSASGFHAFGYGRWEDEGWYAMSRAGLSYFRQKHVRHGIPGLAGTALSLQQPVGRSRRSVWGAFADVEVGRKLDLGGVDAALFARLTGTGEYAGAAGESGADIFGYTLHAERSMTAAAGRGIRLSGTHALGNWHIVPELELSYARVLGPDRFTAATSLLTRRMEASTGPLGRDIVSVGAKLDFRLRDGGPMASAGYSGAFRRSANQHRVRLGLSLAF